MIAEVTPPSTFDPYSLAEYIEIRFLVSPVEHLSPPELRSYFPSGQSPSSTEISLAMAEIERRASVTSSAYPYRISDNGVIRIESDLTAAYDLMLLLSMESTPMRTEGDYRESDPLFDAVVREATGRLLGPEGRSLIFGWPPRDGRPTDFGAAVTWVGEQVGIPDGSLDRPTEEKDAGVDVIAWKSFNDSRAAFPVYLFQNTLRADYVNKAREVVPSMWHDWLRFGTLPSTGFAIPFVVPSGDDRWQKLAYSADVVLDRLRIAGLINPLTRAFPELELISAFNAKQIDQIISGSASRSVAVRRPRRQRASIHRDVRTR
jgi:hypothetical protein